MESRSEFSSTTNDTCECLVQSKKKQNSSTGHLYDAHDSIWMLFHAQNNNMHNTHLHNVQCSMFNLSFYWFHTRRWYRCHNRSQRLTFYYRHCSGDILFSIQWKKAHFPNHLNVEHARILQRTEPYLKSHEFRLSSSSSHCGRKQDEEYH